MDKKVCPKCGYENPPEAKFCINCGYKFPEYKEAMDKYGLSTYLYVSGILSVIFLLDSFINDVYRTMLFSILFVPYIISIVGIILILYLFLKKSLDKESHLKLFLLGNLLAGIGGLIIYVIPILTGHIVASLYWLLFLIIGYKVNKIRKG